MQGRNVRIVAVIVALLCGAACASAQAAKPLPAYTSPGYDGPTKAPATAPPAPPPQIKLSAGGTFPNAVVDAAGTAHVVWNEGRGDQADAAVYCRIKRGEKGCDSTTQLVPLPHYGQFDSPSYDTDDGLGPKIMQIGNQLVVLSFRYPTSFNRPDAATYGDSGGVVEWSSQDGGTTWTGGVLAAREDISGGAVAFGPDDAPRIATISQERYCGTCVGQLKAGAYDGTVADLGAGFPGANYFGSLALDNGLPAVGFSDLSHTSYVRRWSGTEPLTSAATWGAPVKVSGDEPDIAGGPSGLFLLTRAPSGTSTLSVRKIAATAASAATRITPKDVSTNFGKLAEDPSGNLIAAWEQTRDDGDDLAGLHMSNAVGSAFGAGRLMIPGLGAGQPAIAAAADGGGFLVGNATGGVNSVGPIVATAFGTQEATNQRGAGDLPGEAGDTDQECGKRSFGAVKILSQGPCLLHGQGAYSAVSVTEGTIDLNGLKIVPDPGSKIVIDPKNHRIYTSGPVRVLAVTKELTITLWHGAFSVDVPDDGPGDPLFSFDTSKFPVDVGGFGVSGKIDVILTPTGVRIPISLKLPPYLGNVTGAAELVATGGTGLELKSLRITAGPIPLGPVLLDNVDISYTADGDVWRGGAALKFPPAGALQASVEFKMGDFNGAAFDYTPPAPGITIGPAIFLTKVGGSFKLNPLHIGIDGVIGAGGAVNGVSPISVDGHFDLDVPNSGPFTLSGHGGLNIAVLHIADANLKYVSSGYATFDANIDLPLPLIKISGKFSGFADGRNLTYGAQGDEQICVDIKIGPFTPPCINGDFAISQAGVAACVSVKVPAPTFTDPGNTATLSGGLELPWNANDAVALLNPAFATGVILSHVRIPCHTSAFVQAAPTSRAHAAQAGATSVTIPGGLPSATVLVTGRGDAPDVTVTGPGGAALDGAHAIVARSAPDVGGTFVVLPKPAAGVYTLTTKAGSVPIAAVAQSAGYTAATVKATLGGSGRDRTVSYKIANNGGGQTVTFIEQAGQGTRTLGTTSKASGTIKFGTGTDLPAGRRTVIALIQKDHLTTDRTTVGSYTAPKPPTLAAPGSVRVVKTSKSKVRVTFSKVPGADHYEIRAKGTHGLRRLLVTKKTAVSITGLAPGDKITATVRAVSALGRRGATARS